MDLQAGDCPEDGEISIHPPKETPQKCAILNGISSRWFRSLALWVEFSRLIRQFMEFCHYFHMAAALVIWSSGSGAAAGGRQFGAELFSQFR